MSASRSVKMFAGAAGLTAAALIGIVAASSGSSALPAARPGAATEQADSVVFDLQFPRIYTETGPIAGIGQVVYCGVDKLAEPFRLDVLVTSPPNLSIPDDPTSEYLTNHDGAGWLKVTLQEATWAQAHHAFRVPANDSLAFGLSLGGRAGKDQLVQIHSEPLGNGGGGGAGFHGVATVLAQAGATDPFEGDDRTDNYCVSIGVEPNPTQPDQVTLPGEYLEGEISVTMPVPDGWVLDGNGTDGGVLAGFPH